MVSPDILNLKMNRKGFGLKSQVNAELEKYEGSWVNTLKSEGYRLCLGKTTFHLAQEFGFCYGVDRAVELAFQTRARYPDRRIFLTTEIIHNPKVNQDLRDRGFGFLAGPYKNATIHDVKSNDVVLVPAFGSSVQELAELMNTGCELVDTTCASVIVVWKRVEKMASEGFTILVHGKYAHEETIATISRVTLFPQAKYFVVVDKHEADKVCRFIESSIEDQNRTALDFLSDFSPQAYSPGFDPTRDFERIGMANQTTMLSSESMAIAAMVKQSLQTKLPETIQDHFRSFDTICNATQERQDAILDLVQKQKLDFLLVIGGYNSSNTHNLTRIGRQYVATYHIDSADALSQSVILHRDCESKSIIQTENWLGFQEELNIGLTAGASTPNQVIDQVIEKIVLLRQDATASCQ
jgi:4-hydroxy-3-methylbut-2-enyl diphosphate reductase